MIQVRDLRFTYSTSDKPSLDVKSLDIDEGATVLCGLTGSGKTTLLRCINGLIPHYYGGKMGGSVLVDGLDTKHIEPGDIASSVGTVFQDPENQFLMLTVREELAFGPRNSGLNEEQIQQRISIVAERLGIAHLISRNIFELSSGEKQKLAIAAILATEPRYMLFDEPTSQLDDASSETLLSLLCDLARERSLLITEHRIERTKNFPFRYIGIENGTLLADGNYANIRQWFLRKNIDIEAAGTPYHRGRKGALMLDARDITAGYGNRRILEDVSVQLFEGEIVMLAGRNGSGKTTLLKSILNFIPGREGKVFFDGKEITNEISANIAKYIAYLSHNPLNYLFHSTLREEMEFTASNVMDGKPPAHHVDDIANDLGIGKKLDQFPREFSCGERETAAIASVLAGGRRCMLLDEPTRGLDYSRKHQFMEMLRSLSDNGYCVLMATHDYPLIMRYADRVYMLEHGKCTEFEPEKVRRELT
ncbi:MAG: ATP-binding cassette domain-containing protein [Methanomassiliicoccales archaeon]